MKPVLYVTIVGGGFVGLALAAVLSTTGEELDVQVTVVDLHPPDVLRARVDEPGLAQALDLGVTLDRLRFVVVSDEADVDTALNRADLTVLCLPTPPDESPRRVGPFDRPSGYRMPDVSAVVEWATRWAKMNVGPQWSTERRKRSILAVKSTVLPGTTARIASLIARQTSDDSVLDRVLFWPEFLAQGSALRDLRHEQVVIGRVRAERPLPPEVEKLLGVSLSTYHTVTDATTAEGVKYASNAMLATRLAIANEIALLVADAGGNGRESVRLAGRDRRIGGQYLTPGAGWGGSCFPKDVEALAASAPSAIVARATLQANDIHTAWTASAVRAAVLHVSDRRLVGPVQILVLGTSFKADTNDTRNARHNDAVAAGATWDGRQVAVASVDRPAPGWGSLVEEADVVVLGTDWPEWGWFTQTDIVIEAWENIPTGGKVLIDLRGGLPSKLDERADSLVLRFGQPIPDPVARIWTPPAQMLVLGALQKAKT